MILTVQRKSYLAYLYTCSSEKQLRYILVTYITISLISFLPRPCRGRPSMLADQNCQVCNIFAKKCMKAREIVGIDNPSMSGTKGAQCRTNWECDYGHICVR